MENMTNEQAKNINMKTTKILKSICLAEKSIVVADLKLKKVLDLIIVFLDFESPGGEFDTNFFHIENVAGDGICLSDNNAKIYHLQHLLKHIESKGKINSYKELNQFAI